MIGLIKRRFSQLCKLSKFEFRDSAGSSMAIFTTRNLTVGTLKRSAFYVELAPGNLRRTSLLKKSVTTLRKSIEIIPRKASTTPHRR